MIRLALKTIYAVMVVFSGLMFIRLILDFAQVAPTDVFGRIVHDITDIVVVPLAQMMYGVDYASRFSDMSPGEIEPHAIVALFVSLFASFVLSGILGAMERFMTRPKDAPATAQPQPSPQDENFWDKKNTGITKR